MSDLNKVMLIGRLTKNPELRTLGETSQTVCSFSVATNSTWKDKTGAKKEQVEFHNIEAWGKLGEICSKYLTKGKQVFLSGRLKTQSWDDKSGVKKYKTLIILEDMQMLGSKNDDSNNTNTNRDISEQPEPESSVPVIDVDDEENVNIEDVDLDDVEL